MVTCQPSNHLVMLPMDSSDVLWCCTDARPAKHSLILLLRSPLQYYVIGHYDAPAIDIIAAQIEAVAAASYCKLSISQ